MKRRNVLLRLSVALLFCLSTFITLSPASAAVPGNRCKDRCNEVYHRRMDECKGMRREQHRCEDRAKRERDDCKHRCR